MVDFWALAAAAPAKKAAAAAAKKADTNAAAAKEAAAAAAQKAEALSSLSPSLGRITKLSRTSSPLSILSFWNILIG